MGARPEDYEKATPYKSYIHVDDYDSPEELAKYLHELDQDDDKYNEYFKWKVRRLMPPRRIPTMHAFFGGVF